MQLQNMQVKTESQTAQLTRQLFKIKSTEWNKQYKQPKTDKTSTKTEHLINQDLELHMIESKNK